MPKKTTKKMEHGKEYPVDEDGQLSEANSNMEDGTLQVNPEHGQI